MAKIKALKQGGETIYPRTSTRAVLDEHGNTVESLLGSVQGVDATLSVSGKSADAKATGDKVKEVKNAVTALQQKVMNLQISGGGGGGIDDDLNLFAVEGASNAEKLYNAINAGGSYSGHRNTMVLEYARCTAPGTGIGQVRYYVLYRDNWGELDDLNADVVIRDTVFEPEGTNPILVQLLYTSGTLTFENCTFRNVLFWFGRPNPYKVTFRGCKIVDNEYHFLQCGEWNSNIEYLIEGCEFRHMRPDKTEYRNDIEYQKETGSLKINGWAHGNIRCMGYDLKMTIRDTLFYDNMGALNIMIQKSSHVDTVDPKRVEVYIERCTFRKTNGAAISFNAQPVTGWIKDCKFINIGENRCNEEGYDFPEDKRLMYGTGTADDPFVYACGVGSNAIFSYNWTPRHELTVSGNWIYNIMENGVEGNYREVSYNHIENTGYRMKEGLWNPSTEGIYGNIAICKGNVICNPTSGEPGIVIPSWSDGQDCYYEDNLIEFAKDGETSTSTGFEIMFQNEKFDYNCFIRRNTIRGFAKKYHIFNTYGDAMPIHIEEDNVNEDLLSTSDYNQRNLSGVDFDSINAQEIARDPYFLSVDDNGLPKEWGVKAADIAVYTNGNERFLRVTGTSIGACAYAYQDYRVGADVYIARIKFRVRSSSGKVGIVPLSMQDAGSIVPNYESYVFNPVIKQFEFATDGDKPNEWHDVVHSVVITENARIAIVNPEIDDTEGAEFVSRMDIKDVSVRITRCAQRAFADETLSVASTPYNFDNLNVSYLPANGFSIQYKIPGKEWAYNGSWSDATWMMGKNTSEELGRGAIFVMSAAKLYNNLVIWYKSIFDLDLGGFTMECGNADTYAFIQLFNGADVTLKNGTITAKNFAVSLSGGCKLTVEDGATVATTGESFALLIGGGERDARTGLTVHGGTIGNTLSYAYTDIVFDVPDGVTATMSRLQTQGYIRISKDNKVTYKNGAGEVVEVTDVRKMTGMFYCTDITVEYAANHTDADLIVTGDESNVAYSYKDENGELQELEGSLTQAWAAASSTAETRQGDMHIKLLDDVYTYTGLYMWGGGNIVLDLNGFAIKTDYQNYALYLRNDMNLTIIDTAERDEVGYIQSANYASVIAANVALNVNGGKFVQPNGIAISATEGTIFTVSGEAALDGKIALSVGTNVSVTLDGGSITGTQFGVQAPAEDESTTAITVHSGVVSSEGIALSAKNATFAALEGKTATITGTVELVNNATIAAKTLVTVDGERCTTYKRATGTTVISYSEDAALIPATAVALSKETLTLTEGGTGTLTATVTPSDSTDSVVWSVSPSGIVNVTGGNVTALKAGNAVITATAGSASAACAVTVTAAASGGEDTPTLLYELPSETTFTNSTNGVIDTGLKLFEDVSTNPKYTILFDVTTGDVTNDNSKYCLLHCMNEVDPWPGFAVQLSQNTNAPSMRMILWRSNTSIVWSPGNKRMRVALRIDGKKFSYAPKDSDMTMTEMDIGSAYCNVPQSLVIGGYRDENDSFGRFYEGTLHELKVYSGCWTKEECQAWVNQTE